jgi:predicted flavoprotein YhiN
VVIYGGTTAGIMAAVQVRKMGQSVIVVSPDKHIGGLSASGLGFTDVGNKSVIGGLSRDFYHRVYLHYNTAEAWKWEAQSEFGNHGQGTAAMDKEGKTMWTFEPHVAETIFETHIADAKIEVLRDEMPRL